jgi:zinc transport system substrate-binding protein
VSCGKSDSGKDTLEKPRVVVTIEPMRYFVEAIAGDRFQVTAMTPPGASPEFYEPTPQQMIDLNTCSAYIRVGTLGFEKTKLQKVADNAPHLYVIDSSKGIHLLPHEGCCEAADGGDPHTWMSPANAKIISRNIFKALCVIDTAGIKDYTTRLMRFEEKMDSIDAQIKTCLQGLTSRTFLVYHPALGYFARDYGLRQLSVEHDGKEPSAEHAAHLIEACKEDNVKYVFIQKEYTGKMARRIAEEIGAEVVEVNLLSYDWEKEILNIARTFAR